LASWHRASSINDVKYDNTRQAENNDDKCRIALMAFLLSLALDLARAQGSDRFHVGRAVPSAEACCGAKLVVSSHIW